MSRLILTLLLLLGATVHGGQAETQLAQLESFYKPQAESPSAKVLWQAVYFTNEAANALCIGAQADTMLAQWHRESRFCPKATGLPREDSSGIAQTRLQNTPQWRRFWKKRGVTLGPFSEVRTQVYMGVSEFYFKLGDAKGDVKDGVRRYNGGLKGRPSMKAALRYADRVMVSRKVIFKRPYVKGEQQARKCPEVVLDRPKNIATINFEPFFQGSTVAGTPPRRHP